MSAVAVCNDVDSLGPGQRVLVDGVLPTFEGGSEHLYSGLQLRAVAVSQVALGLDRFDHLIKAQSHFSLTDLAHVAALGRLTVQTLSQGRPNAVFLPR